MTLTFLQFNNYYNRMLKRYETLTQYLQNAVEVITIPDTDFNTNDGVSTTKIVNLEFGLYPDYMLALDGGAIITRWYVMDCRRIRKGQYEITLQRDLVADYYNNVLDAPIFLEKGYINANSPLIFNPENMTFNQIKTKETLLKDKTGIPWIVGYVSLPAESEEDKQVIFRQARVTPGIVEPSLTGWTYYFDTQNYRTYITEESYSIAVDSQGVPLHHDNVYTIEFNSSGVIQDVENYSSYPPSQKITYNNKQALKDKINQGLNLGRTGIALGNLLGGRTDVDHYTAARALDKQIIQFTDQGDKLYQINFTEELVSSTPDISTVGTTKVPAGGGLFYELNSVVSGQINNPTTLITGTASQPSGAAQTVSYGYKYKGKKYKLTLTEISNAANETVTVKTSRRQLEDAPYCMFCIPYGAIDVVHDGGSFETEASIGLNIGSAFRATSWCYDVQVLPYCPIASIRDQATIDLRSLTEHVDYSLPSNLQYTQQVVLWCSYSSGSFDIDYTMNMPTDPVEFKVGALTKM